MVGPETKRGMLIREYRQGDVTALTRLFYETIHSVNPRDYSAPQVQAWAPAIPDAELWHSRMIGRCTLVAEENGEIVGFAEMERNGHLDMFFCRADSIRHGVGRELYRIIELKAIALGLKRIFAEVSLTAVPFFEHCGFTRICLRTVVRAGIELSNFRMEKRLSSLT
jgi:putative acetyltransferase